MGGGTDTSCTVPVNTTRVLQSTVLSCVQYMLYVGSARTDGVNMSACERTTKCLEGVTGLDYLFWGVTLGGGLFVLRRVCNGGE